MKQYILNKFVSSIPLALGIIIIVSILNHLVPGDAVDRILGEYASEKEKISLRKQLGLDQHLGLQILSYLKKVLSGNLGESLIYNRSVSSMIFERIRATLELAILSVLLALILGTVIGMITANINSNLIKSLK